VITNFNSSTKGLLHVIAEAIYRFDGISAEQGAQKDLYLATEPVVESVSGKYFAHCKRIPSSKRSYDLAVRQRLWNVSAALIQQEGMNI
jgi:hypothetical protein